MPPDKPLIEAIPDRPSLPELDCRERAAEDIAARPTLATTKDIAGRIYVEPDQAVDRILAHYVETGDRAGLISEIERSPAEFGELRGTTRLGLANTERRNALEQAPVLARQTGAHFDVVGQVEERVVGEHTARQIAQSKPLPDLSPEATQFLAQLQAVERLPVGPDKIAQTRALLSDKASVQEVGRFRQALSERYGKGQTAIRDGLSKDPAVKSKPASERGIVQTRVTTVLQAFPIVVQMQERVRQHDRTPDLGKDQSRGIER